MITIRIIYDNTTTRDDLTADWGFACLVETESHRILFDTGKDSGIFRANMAGLDIAPESVDTVFVSGGVVDAFGDAFLDTARRELERRSKLRREGPPHLIEPVEHQSSLVRAASVAIADISARSV